MVMVVMAVRWSVVTMIIVVMVVTMTMMVVTLQAGSVKAMVVFGVIGAAVVMRGRKQRG